MSKYIYTMSNYRAIKKAEIIIDGITVLAGENGTGKSTLSRWLYGVTKVLCNYEAMIENDARKSLKSLLQQIERSRYFLRFPLSQNSWSEMLRFNSFPDDLSMMKKYVLRIIDLYQDALLSYFERDRKNDILVKRLATLFGLENESISDPHLLVDRICDQLRTSTEFIVNKAEESKDERRIETFCELLSELDEPLESGTVDVSLVEDDVELIESEHFNPALNIHRVIYYKTYELLDYLDRGSDFHDYLERPLGKINPDEMLLVKLLNQILDGKIDLSKGEILSERQLYYRREDGLEIPLRQAATGLVSFSFLARLLENGYLREGSLLIVDEPEAHLHPKWIVEYARMLVFLQKRLGLKILLSSHNPDMIAAIDAITRKEGVAEHTNFYFAQSCPDDKHQYVFKKLNSIGEIFDSFNVAITHIQEYGE